MPACFSGEETWVIKNILLMPMISEQLIWVMSEKGDSAAVDRLMSIAKTDPDRELRKKAIFWLGQMNDPRIKQFMLDIING